MNILGNRVLVSKLEEPKAEGYQTVEVQDSFVYKGKVELMGTEYSLGMDIGGCTVVFAKYSPDTQEIDWEGKKCKIVNVDDILAVL